MRPVEGLTEPTGREPVTPKDEAQVAGGDLIREAWPPVPVAVAGLVMTGAARATLMVKAWFRYRHRWWRLR